MTSEEAADLFEQADEQGLGDDSKVFSLLLNAYGNPGDDDFIPIGEDSIHH